MEIAFDDHCTEATGMGYSPPSTNGTSVDVRYTGDSAQPKGLALAADGTGLDRASSFFIPSSDVLLEGLAAYFW